MLDLVERALEQHGILFQRLDGTLTLEQRKKAIDTFRNDTSCIVLLASIGSAGVGLV